MPHGDTDPDEPNDTRNNAVCDLASRRVVGELQAQTSLDEGEGQEDPAPPDVES